MPNQKAAAPPSLVRDKPRPTRATKSAEPADELKYTPKLHTDDTPGENGYYVDSIGRAYPLDSYGTRIYKSIRPNDIAPSVWNKLSEVRNVALIQGI